MYDGVLVNTKGVDTLEARKTGNPSKNIGPSKQLTPVSDKAINEAITELQSMHCDAAPILAPRPDGMDSIRMEFDHLPSAAAVIPKPNMDEARIRGDAKDSKQQHMQDLLPLAPNAANAPEANAHTDNTTSYNGFHSCLLKVFPISSGSTQSATCSILSSMEKSSSTGRLLSDEISAAVAKGDVDAEAGLNPRDEQVLLSYSELLPVAMLFPEKQEPECMQLVQLCSVNQNEERHPADGYIAVSFAGITKCRLDSAGDDEPSKCAALISMQPITDEDQLAALGRSSYYDKVVGSPALGYSHHVVPTDQHGGEPRPCTNIGKLRRNLTEMQKQFDASRARSYIPPPFLTNGLSPTSEGGRPFSSH
ncbi:hypothetical protein Nepgr_015770 [Nepenthes gracilis]|uniref:Uncharacterized protein n=1 Tax=Nepenthes gracilis TaxID=150966 RepID=A0AAD3SNJ9_NEPGR|nr:hypothetical protein Nepgr_015770 [Nepenthes gracilis]